MNEELIMQVANLISEGKGEALEEAIRRVTNGVPTETTVAEGETPAKAVIDDEPGAFGDDDYEGENDYDEYEDVVVHHDITDCLNGLAPMTAVVPKAILVLPMPTVYGVAMLVDMSKYNYSVGRVETLFNGEYSVLPVTIESLMYDDEKQNEAFVYDPALEDENVKYALIVPKQEVNKDVGYIFPMRGSYAGMGGVATDPVDMVNAVRTLYGTITDTDPVTLPVIGYKVTKPDGTCKGMAYEPDQYYTTDGEVVMHKSGFHFATRPEMLKTWYKGPYINNRPWIVQAGPYVETNAKGIAVSNGIIFVEELCWNDLT